MTTTGQLATRATGKTISTPLLLTLALLSSIAPFGTDLYLPSFPRMVTELSTSQTGVQLSLTAFLIGAGVGQVLFGPLSDRLGRRSPLVVGTIVFVLASATAALAPTLVVLIAARLVQGLSGAAGMVISRAIVADRTKGVEAARALSLMMLVGGIAPIIAPFAGSTLAGVVDWRGLLWIVTVIGAIAAAATLVLVRDTRRARPTAAHDGLARHGLARQLASPAYVGNAVAFGFGFATMMSYISASPFLYQGLMGLSTIEYGLAFALNALALSLVSMLSRRLNYRFPAAALARAGLLINLTAIVVLALLAVLHVNALWLAVPIFFAVGSLGLVFGNSTALALHAIPQASGLGSAFLGLLQFALAGIISPLVSIGGKGTAIPLALTMLGAALVANAGAAFAAAARRRAARQAAPLAG
ncbi:MAG TPA: multidrug effflux MFS transporter [Pseudonocardiaceae bacterium]